jgi:PAS domain S-box-containing protein
MAPPPRRLPLLERVYGSRWSTPLALALVVGSVLFLVVFPRLAARRIDRLREDMLDRAAPAHQAAGRIERAVALEMAAVRGFLLNGDARFRDRFREAGVEEEQAGIALVDLAEQLGGEVAPRVQAYRDVRGAWRDPMVALMEGRLGREAYVRDLPGQQARFESVIASLQAVDAAIVFAEDSRRREIEAAERTESRWMAVAALVAVLSAVVAGAIARRLRVLTRRARRRADEEQELRILARALAGAPTAAAVVQHLVDSAVSQTRATGAYVEQANETEVAVVAVSGAGTPAFGLRVPYPGSLTETILAGRDPEIVPTAAALGASMTGYVQEACPGCSALVVPMFSEADLQGALILLRGPGTSPFDDADVAYARIVGDLASAALRRVTLLEQTQRERRALVASEEQFRALAETAQVAIFVISAADDTIVFANRPVERIFGYTAEELIGRPLVMLMPPELRSSHRAGVERYVTTGERRLSWEGVEMPALSKDGREVPIEITMGEFFREGQRYFTAIARDITERRKAEQDKAGLLRREREARERAEAAIRTREEVLAIVSHDLRNPLNTIAMGAAALKDFSSDEATRVRYVQMIQRSIQRMNRLIEDLLDVVRLEGGQKLALNLAEVDLGSLLNELAESFRALAEPRQQTFLNEAEEGLLVVNADRDRLSQVVTNLVGNALKFTPEGGLVEVRARSVDGEVQVAVRDTGPGMSPEELGRIFDPYWQAGRTARLGAGLGLTISKGIVESHGGRLWVDSRPGAGSTFTFALPLAADAARAPGPAAERSGSTA